MSAVIYAITNLITGDQYIGQTCNYKHRLQAHRSIVREHNKKLKADFLQYGLESFAFEIIEECTEENKYDREMYYIAQLNPSYNMTKGGIAPLGYHHTAEAKSILSEYGKKQWARKTEEEKAAFVKNNLKGPAVGHSVSEETRAKLRDANIGKVLSPEAKARRAELLNARGFYQKLAKKRQRPVVCVETGERFDSVKSAMAKYGTTIGPHLRGRYKTCKGLHFEYLECRG